MREFFRGWRRKAGLATLAMGASLVALLLVAMVIAPFLYREYREARFDEIRRNEREQADRHWKRQEAEIYIGRAERDLYVREINGVTIRDEFDTQTGLHFTFYDRGEAYNTRVRELLASEGVPEWSMKPHLVRDTDLIAMLDSLDREEITKFPHELTDGIILMRRGTISRWNSHISNDKDSLSIVTRYVMISAGNEVEPVYVGTNPNYPRVIFIRSGSTMIHALHTEGRHLSTAYR